MRLSPSEKLLIRYALVHLIGMARSNDSRLLTIYINQQLTLNFTPEQIQQVCEKLTF